MADRTNEPAQRLTATEKVGYGFGDLASNLFWQMFSIFIAKFYTDVFLLSAAAMGTMLLVTRMFDSVTDPLMGAIADRTNTRWGKFRPYLVWVTVRTGLTETPACLPGESSGSTSPSATTCRSRSLVRSGHM